MSSAEIAQAVRKRVGIFHLGELRIDRKRVGDLIRQLVAPRREAAVHAMSIPSKPAKIAFGFRAVIGEIRSRGLYFLRDGVREARGLVGEIVGVGEPVAHVVRHSVYRCPSENSGGDEQQDKQRKSEGKHAPDGVGIDCTQLDHGAPPVNSEP